MLELAFPRLYIYSSLLIDCYFTPYEDFPKTDPFALVQLFTFIPCTVLLDWKYPVYFYQYIIMVICQPSSRF
jgi:hypothetical protein